MILKDGVTQATDKGLYVCKAKAADKAPNGSLIVVVDDDAVSNSTLLPLSGSVQQNDDRPITPYAERQALTADRDLINISYVVRNLNETTLETSFFSFRPTVSKLFGTLVIRGYPLWSTGEMSYTWSFNGYAIASFVTVAERTTSTISSDSYNMFSFPLPTNGTAYAPSGVFKSFEYGTWSMTGNYGNGAFVGSIDNTNHVVTVKYFLSRWYNNTEGFVGPIPLVISGTGKEMVWN